MSQAGYWFIDRLWLPGRQACDCSLPLSASSTDVLWSLEKLPTTSEQLHSVLWCADQQQVPFPGFHAGQGVLEGWSGHVGPCYGVHTRHRCQVRFSRMPFFFLILLQLRFCLKKVEYELLMESGGKGGLLSISWHVVCNHVIVFQFVILPLCFIQRQQYTQRGCWPLGKKVHQ